jgi:hypothetical protein
VEASAGTKESDVKLRAQGTKKPLALLAAAATLLAAVSGCRLVQRTAEMPISAVSAMVPGKNATPPDPAVLQTELQRFSDEYLGRSLTAMDEYQAAAEPSESRQILIWKYSLGSSVISIVSGPNPTANLVDFLAVSTLVPKAIENYAAKTAGSPALQRWLDVSRSLEKAAWNLAAKFLTPNQGQELRDRIQQWWEANPDTRNAYFVRPQEITLSVRQTKQGVSQAGSVFALVGLDPTAGLDPAVREVTRTRLFAERAMYTAQWMPMLVRWQAEMLTSDFFRNSNVQLTLTNMSSLAQSAESVSKVATELPDRITAERKAILEALQAQEGKLRDLSAEVTRTLDSGQRMSVALNATLGTFNGLMKRFGVGEPSLQPPDTNSPPFNILDYARTADQLTILAKELNALLKDAGKTVDSPALKQHAQDLAAMSERAKADAKSVLNYAFLLGAALILLAFACAVFYQRLKPRGASAPSYAPSDIV